MPRRDIEQKVENAKKYNAQLGHDNYYNILQLIKQAAAQGINIHPTFVEYTMYDGQGIDADKIDHRYPYYDINILDDIPSELKNKFDIIMFGDSVVYHIVESKENLEYNSKKVELMTNGVNVLKYLLGHQFKQLFKESSKLQIVFCVDLELKERMGKDLRVIKSPLTGFDTGFGVGYYGLPPGISSASKLFRLIYSVFSIKNIVEPRLFAKQNGPIGPNGMVHAKELLFAARRGEF
jgi:hypothetical protein